jgi:phage-related minor tail protein
VLKTVGKSLATSALKSALKPVENGLSSLFSGGFESLFSAFTPAASSAAPSVQPFADGGVISTPTYFPMGRSMGLMGERGAEAIMPLSRGPDGKLGVRGGGGGGRPISVQVNITTPDAESFRRSEAQVSAALAIRFSHMIRRVPWVPKKARICC